MGVCFNELALRFYLLLSLGREDRGERVKEVKEEGERVKEARNETRKKKSANREHREVFSKCCGELCACLFIC